MLSRSPFRQVLKIQGIDLSRCYLSFQWVNSHFSFVYALGAVSRARQTPAGTSSRTLSTRVSIQVAHFAQ